MDLRKVFDVINEEYVYVNFDSITHISYSVHNNVNVMKFHLADCNIITTEKVDLIPISVEDRLYEPSIRKFGETDIELRDRINRKIKERIDKWLKKN